MTKQNSWIETYSVLSTKDMRALLLKKESSGCYGGMVEFEVFDKIEALEILIKKRSKNL